MEEHQYATFNYMYRNPPHRQGAGSILTEAKNGGADKNLDKKEPGGNPCIPMKNEPEQ